MHSEYYITEAINKLEICSGQRNNASITNAERNWVIFHIVLKFMVEVENWSCGELELLMCE